MDDQATPPAGTGAADDGFLSEFSPPPAPAAPDPVRRSRRPLALAAALVVVLAVAGGAAAFALTRGGTPTLAGWLPAHPLAVAEMVFEPSAGQSAALAVSLARFPAIAGADANSAFSRIDAAMADAGIEFKISDITPWLGRSAVVAAYAPSAAPGATPGVLLAAAVRDEKAASAFLANLATRDMASADYAGARLTVAKSGASAWTVYHGVLLAGTTGAVKAALDTAGAGTAAADPGYAAALAASDPEHLFFAFVAVRDVARLAAQSSNSIDGVFGRLSGALGDASPAPSATPDPAVGKAIDALPAWAAVTLRATTSGFALEAAAPHTAALDTASDRASRLAAHLPADTVAAIDIRDAGAALAAAIKAAQTDMPADSAAVIGGVTGLIGDISWLGDIAVAALPSASAPSPVIIAEVGDGKGFTALVEKITAMAGITPSTAAHGAAVITTLDTGAGIAVSYAVADGRAVIAIDPAAVGTVLDTGAGGLAADAGYTSLFGANAKDAFSAFADIAQLRSLYGADLQIDAAAHAYIDPLHQIGASANFGSAIDRLSVVLTLTAK
jgi:hypothetical protein